MRRLGSVSSHALALAGLGGAGLLALALRLPFAWTGIGPDEGGYAYVAQRWAHGVALYHGAWVDRPQGLLLAYRALLALSDSPASIRAGAVLFGCGVTLLLGLIAWQLAGPVAAVAAAAIYAVAGTAPALEGFTFNGELAAALPASAAVAAAVVWRSSRTASWLLAAGAAGAIAMLMKQTGVDGILVALVVAGSSSGSRARLRAVLLVLAGFAVPIAASALHGAVTGWHDYWFAVGAYKLNASSAGGATLAQRLTNLGQTLPVAVSLLAPLLGVAVLGLVAFRARRPAAIGLVWLAAALVGFNLGGLYWPHYYLQLIPPLALLAGIAAAALPNRALGAALAAAAAAPVGIALARLPTLSHERLEERVPYYKGYEQDVKIARVLRAKTRPGEQIYVLSSRADLYFLAGRATSYRYIWDHQIAEVPGAIRELRALLTGPQRPSWVVAYKNPLLVDRSGQLLRNLIGHYCFVGQVHGTLPVLFRRPAAGRDCGLPRAERRLEASWRDLS